MNRSTIFINVVIVCLSLSGTALAAVIATVDRSSVELNESFTLKLTVDSQIDTEPNVTALQTDFYVGSVSNISNTTILNGEVNRSRTWSYVLMAKLAGDLVIPPIAVGSDESNPVPIKVLPQSTAAPGEADIFITTEVDNTNGYVQAQILYTVRTYRAVATRQPRWSEPAATGVESLVEVAGEEKNYEAMLNGKPYNVIERVYAFFPQQSGDLNIAPATFQARVLRDGRITGRKVFQSQPISIKVNPIPPPPADYPDAAWFPAKSVELRQDWSRELDKLPMGEPITRHISVIAAGQLQTQIPVVAPGTPASVRVYPDKPEERTVAGTDGIRALRRDQYALIGTEIGEVELPEIVLPWWNVDAAEWNFASLPATRLNIVASPNAIIAPPPDPDPVEPTDVPVMDTVVVHSDLWRRISEGMAVLWVLTVFTWWWSRRMPRARIAKEPKEPPLHKQQARFLKAARKSALGDDVSGVKAAMLDWARLQWPDDTPRSVGDIADRVSMPFSTELRAMCKASYGSGTAQWSGEDLSKSIRSFAVLQEDQVIGKTEELPPLLPDEAA